MGSKKDILERRNWVKCNDPIFMRLVRKNRYSDYLNLTGFTGHDAAVLQSIVLADLADTILDETDMSVDTTIEMFECFFESRFKKILPRPPFKEVKIVWKWRGIEAGKIQDWLIDRGKIDPKHKLTPHELGKVLSVVAQRSKLIERRMKENKYLYLCNGYRAYLTD